MEDKYSKAFNFLKEINDLEEISSILKNLSESDTVTAVEIQITAKGCSLYGEPTWRMRSQSKQLITQLYEKFLEEANRRKCEVDKLFNEKGDNE